MCRVSSSNPGVYCMGVVFIWDGLGIFWWMLVDFMPGFSRLNA